MMDGGGAIDCARPDCPGLSAVRSSVTRSPFRSHGGSIFRGGRSAHHGGAAGPLRLSLANIPSKSLQKITHHFDCDHSVTLYEIVKITLIQNQQHRRLLSSGAGKARLIVDERQLSEIAPCGHCCEWFFCAMPGATDQYSPCEENK